MSQRLVNLTAAELVALVGGIAAGLGVLIQAIRKVAPFLRRVGHLVDDLIGEPSRPGVPARPSLMERVAIMEDEVRTIKNQVLPNGGDSLRDEVDGIRAKLDDQLSDDPPGR